MTTLPDLTITLVIGSYLYTSGAIIWLERKIAQLIAQLMSNHVKHLEERLEKVEARLEERGH